MYYIFKEKACHYFETATLKNLCPVPHIHAYLELVYLYSGQSHATADNRTDLLCPGDLFFSFSNQIHYHDDVAVEGILITVAPELFPDLMDIFNTKLPQNPVIKKEQLPSDICQQLQKICECINSPEKLNRIAANGYMQGLLAELIMKMPLLDIENNFDRVRDILVYCLEKHKEPLSLEHLAQELHLSKYYISHIFTDRLNISFPNYINGLRIENACRLLDKGDDITDVAFESGFNSIRSFNRNFKRNMGMTPTEYIHRNKK